MATATGTTTPTTLLRRALAIAERIDPPASVNVSIDAGDGTCPPSVAFHPETERDLRAVWGPLSLFSWTRHESRTVGWVTAHVNGVEVAIYDARQGR